MKNVKAQARNMQEMWDTSNGPRIQIIDIKRGEKSQVNDTEVTYCQVNCPITLLCVSNLWTLHHRSNFPMLRNNITIRDTRSV